MFGVYSGEMVFNVYRSIFVAVKHLYKYMYGFLARRCKCAKTDMLNILIYGYTEYMSNVWGTLGT